MITTVRKPLMFGTDYKFALCIDADQNIGIGTDVPGAKLEVAGPFQAQSGFIIQEGSGNHIPQEFVTHYRIVKIVGRRRYILNTTIC